MDNQIALDEAEEAEALVPIRVETALSRFPIHQLSKSGGIDIDLHNQAGAIHWEVSHSSKYGHPGPLAYKLDTLVINRHIDESGKPAPELLKLGSLSEIAKEMGTTHSGKSLGNIRRALHQNASAYVEAKITFRGSDGGDHSVEEGFNRYSVILTGEKLPNGRKADAVYVRLHPTYRYILNTALTRPLDYDYMKALTPSAQRLYEIASYQIYSALKNNAPRARVRYSIYCALAPAPRYDVFEQVKKQMYKVHRPHLENGYLSEIKYEASTDDAGQPDWIILYKPGPNASRWYQEFLPGVARTTRRARNEGVSLTLPLPDLFAPLPTAHPAPPQTVAKNASSDENPLTNESAETDALIAELKANELNGSDAVQFAQTKPSECRRQLDFLPYVASFTSTKGAYLRHAIQQDYGPPKAYTEMKAKTEQKQQCEVQASTMEPRKAAYEARTKAEAAQLEEMFVGLKTIDPEAYELFLVYVNQEKEALNERHKRMPEKIKADLLSRIDGPEKQRELFVLWQAERAGAMGLLELRLPATPSDIEKQHISPASLNEINAECEIYNSTRNDKQSKTSASQLLNEWLQHIRHEGRKIADPDKAYTEYAFKRIYSLK